MEKEVEREGGGVVRAMLAASTVTLLLLLLAVSMVVPLMPLIVVFDDSAVAEPVARAWSSTTESPGKGINLPRTWRGPALTEPKSQKAITRRRTGEVVLDRMFLVWRMV